MRTSPFILLALTSFFCASQILAQDPSSWHSFFKNPPAIYRPTPFWHLNGKMDTANLNRELRDVKYASGFGGVTILPVTAQKGFGSPKTFPGMEPAYFSKEYFDLYADILSTAKSLGLQVIWYDDIDFPSGTAGGEFKKIYPQDRRKILQKKDTLLGSGAGLSIPLPQGALMAAVAMDQQTKARIDLSPFVKDRRLDWTAPAGNWKVMLFTASTVTGGSINENAVDYLDPVAIDKYFSINQDIFAGHFSAYFGNTIRQTFFDDVGFYTGSKNGEKTWTNRFNEKFIARTGKSPALLYPALWEDIGPETEAARIAFFDTRAELIAEGYPRKASEWDARHGLMASGHPPGNYEIQPVDMNADIIKYYRHEHIPTMDLIFFYGHGREGYKLVSSAANLYDRPVAAAEIYGAIGWFNKNEMNRNLLYRGAMDVFTRGINFLIPHGMWYNPDSAAVRIPPLISAYSADLGPELPAYNAWAGRSCMLLQGGQTVVDIGLVYPIASLEGWFYFDAKDNKSVGKFAPPATDYLALSDILSNQVHRDFTFLHPETIGGEKFAIGRGIATLNNRANKQNYRVLILPAGKIIWLKALEKLKIFYEQGGAIIATTQLPSQSAEFGKNAAVAAIIKSMFGIDPSQPMPTDMAAPIRNANGGRLLFIPKPDGENLRQAFSDLGLGADLVFDHNPQPNSGKGALSYIHKRKAGRDIYLLANSSDDDIHTYITLRGKLRPEWWNPHDGSISTVEDLSYPVIDKVAHTRFRMDLPAVHSLFVVAKQFGMH